MNTITDGMNSILDYQNKLKVDTMFNNQNQAIGAEQKSNFSDMFSSALNNMEQQVTTSNDNISKVITGDMDNLHTAMIDMSTSQLVLQSAVQVRNKCIEAYNDVKNMQF